MKNSKLKIEERVEEGMGRTKVIENVIEFFLFSNRGKNEYKEKNNKEKIEDFLSWDVAGVKVNGDGVRVNVVEVKCKSSNVRFILNQKILEMKKRFEEGEGCFLDNKGSAEKIVFRVR